MTRAPRPSIRAILFDKDGTLLDFQKTWAPLNRDAAAFAAGGDGALAHRLLAEHGMDPQTGITAPDSLLAAASNGEIATAWVASGAPFEGDALARELDRRFAAGASTAVPVTDLAELFGRLRARGLKLGIASSDSEGGIRAMMQRFGIDDLTDFVAGYDTGHGRKPGPGMVHAFCAAVGIDPAETAVVGDNLHDMDMAGAAGVALRVAVLTGTGTRANLAAHADACLDTIDQLEALLDARMLDAPAT
jgi:phosphoglycolate phosphatase